jgi:hypothetical protein
MLKQKSDPSSDKKIIKATPTKEFFISMLIKDITLVDAIGDLIDNSVDGANRHSKDDDLSKFHINISVNKNKFEIKDNCGGIDINIARNYAFRFGRPTEYKMEMNSIGQFGIGMKRAFFKIGTKIEITSTTLSTEFNTTIDTKIWQKDKKWDFEFTSFRENIKNIPTEKVGTTISISDLSDELKEKELSKFVKELNLEIAKEHLYSINKGLTIKINGYALKSPSLTLISDKEFKPAYWHHKWDGGLIVDILCGISEDDGEKGGWYIFCNERLITGPNTTALTGWTGRGEGGVALYHDQFYRFRGYAFFNSKDPSELPWNTTKTGIDKDTAKYKYVKEQMILMMRPVMSLMNQLKKEKEKDTPESERLLNIKVKKAHIKSIFDVLKNRKRLSGSFSYPNIKMKKEKSGVGTIRYTKPYPQIDEVKKKLRVSRLEEVGKSTFEYYYKNEIGE